MLGRKQWFGPVLALALGGCGDDPQPMTARMEWADGCIMEPGFDACSGQNHTVVGAAGSPAVDVSCGISASGGVYNVRFRAAVLQPGETTFDETNEGIVVTGTVAGVDREMDMGGSIQVRGRGYRMAAPITPGREDGCHVYITGISGQSFRGQIRCERIRDDAVPPRLRYVRGTGNTRQIDRADFEFSNCEME